MKENCEGLLSKGELLQALKTMESNKSRSRGGSVVRALAFHQCGPGSIPGLGVICGLSLLLVLFSVLLSVFPRVLRFSPLPLPRCHMWVEFVVGSLLCSERFFSGYSGFPLSLGVICGLSLLLVLFSAPRGFSPGTPVFPSPQKPTLSKFQFDLDTVDDKSHRVDVHC